MYTVDDVPLVEELPLFLSFPIQHWVDSFTFVCSGKSFLYNLYRCCQTIEDFCVQIHSHASEISNNAVVFVS